MIYMKTVNAHAVYSDEALQVPLMLFFLPQRGEQIRLLCHYLKYDFTEVNYDVGPGEVTL